MVSLHDNFNIKSIKLLWLLKENSTNLISHTTQTPQIYCRSSAVNHVERRRVGHIRLVVRQNCVLPGVHAAQDQIEAAEGELRGSPVLRGGVRQRLLLLLLRSLLPAALEVGSGSHMHCDAARVQNIHCNQQVVCSNIFLKAS